MAYRSTVTRTTVWGRERLRRQMRKRKGKQSFRHDEVTTELVETGEQRDLEEQQPNIAKDVMFCCKICGKLYKLNKAFQEHMSVCQKPQLSQSVRDRAIRMALLMIGTHNAPIYTTKGKHPAVLLNNISDTTKISAAQRIGWANRPGYGNTLGKNTIERFVVDLKGWFEEGRLDKEKKMSASRMRERLQNKYPGRYDIPSEQSIIAFISREFRKVKESVRLPMEGVHSNSRTKRYVIPTTYYDTLKAILLSNTSLMPREGRVALIEALSITEGHLPPDFPEEGSIKSKVSSLKAAAKKGGH